MRKAQKLLILFLFAFTLTACNSDADIFDSDTKQKDEVNEETVLIDFTLEELAAYDGKDGNMAYIAVSGIVYDVTDEWNNGEHNGVMAGTDATEQINSAPHGTSILEELEIIGNLVEIAENMTVHFTLEELSLFDGLNGSMSYISVEGIVYDVSFLWNNGLHDGVYAGTDASVAFAGSSHLRGLISLFTVVGELSE